MIDERCDGNGRATALAREASFVKREAQAQRIC
jgi:hypothetical protein